MIPSQDHTLQSSSNQPMWNTVTSSSAVGNHHWRNPRRRLYCWFLTIARLSAFIRSNRHLSLPPSNLDLYHHRRRIEMKIEVATIFGSGKTKLRLFKPTNTVSHLQAIPNEESKAFFFFFFFYIEVSMIWKCLTISILIF